MIASNQLHLSTGTMCFVHFYFVFGSFVWPDVYNEFASKQQQQQPTNTFNLTGLCKKKWHPTTGKSLRVSAALSMIFHTSSDIWGYLFDFGQFWFVGQQSGCLWTAEACWWESRRAVSSRNLSEAQRAPEIAYAAIRNFFCAFLDRARIKKSP